MDWGSGRGFVAARATSGGPARRGSPACGALTIAVAYRLRKLAQKGDKVGACLTEVQIGRGGRAGSSAVKIGGGEERSSWMNRCRAPPGLRVRRGGPRGHCKGVEGVQGGQSTSGGEKFRQRRSSPAADARRNPGAGVAELVGPEVR